MTRSQRKRTRQTSSYRQAQRNLATIDLVSQGKPKFPWISRAVLLLVIGILLGSGALTWFLYSRTPDFDKTMYELLTASSKGGTGSVDLETATERMSQFNDFVLVRTLFELAIWVFIGVAIWFGVDLYRFKLKLKHYRQAITN